MLETTIKYENRISGVGLHTGREINLRFLPAGQNHGIVFKKKTKDGEVFIPANFQYARESELCTTLVNGNEQLSTIEHLMSALNAMDIDNILIEVDGDEIPIVDGSAKTYTEILQESETFALDSKRKYIQIITPLHYANGITNISLSPSEEPTFSCRIDFDKYPVIGQQEMSINLTPEVFINDISYARTFGFYADHEFLQSKGLARGASLDNTVVIDRDGSVMNASGLRDSKEFVRHKILDAVGDIKLAGKKILGHFKGICPSHRSTYILLKILFSRPDCWRIISA